jgi:23S rRNA (adenine1618-N6)-methyltransferase
MARLHADAQFHPRLDADAQFHPRLDATAQFHPRLDATAQFHPRNRHQGHYDFAALALASPEFAPWLVENPRGARLAESRDERHGRNETSTASETLTIDFSNPAAVRALNTALLRQYYGVAQWDLPHGYLCPPIPGRADYVHALAQLLGNTPPGRTVRLLDVGVGASCIYPILAAFEYGWHSVGSDIDSRALAAAQRNVAGAGLAEAQIALRLQPNRGQIFQGIVHSGDYFDVTLCNPPFHASASEAARGNVRKTRNLGAGGAAQLSCWFVCQGKQSEPTLNFGGQAEELWCTGGEASFIKRMIRESYAFADQVNWFSTLVAKSEHLSDIEKQLGRLADQAAGRHTVEMRVVPMAQGAKQSRFVAWRFCAKP